MSSVTPPSLTLKDIDYPLPEELIAVQPTGRREESRLMYHNRDQGLRLHKKFSDIVDLIQPHDLLVFNNSRVLQARLLGSRQGREAEMLLVERVDARHWKAMVKHSRKFKVGDLFVMPECSITILEKLEDGMRLICFDREVSFDEINQWGHTPVPPYIVKKRSDMGMEKELDLDEERYQSIMARYHGSVAAPTASLHFSQELLESLQARGVGHTEVTLHIGPGTFKPIEGDLDQFHIHREWVEVSAEAVQDIEDCKNRGGRVVAIGTTVVRSLETAALRGRLEPFQGYTELFISPPFPFKVTDVLITNFHMPRSTLLLLVYAFGGRDFIRQSYDIAIQEKYRFFSYGDAMFIE